MAFLCCFRPSIDTVSFTSSFGLQETFENSLKTLSRKVCDRIFSLTREAPSPFESFELLYRQIQEANSIFREVLRDGLLYEEEPSDRVVPIRAQERIPLQRRNNPALETLIGRIENCALYNDSFERRYVFNETLALEEQIKRVSEVAHYVLFTIHSRRMYAVQHVRLESFAAASFFLPTLGYNYLQSILTAQENVIKQKLFPPPDEADHPTTIHAIERGGLIIAEKSMDSMEFDIMHEAVVLSQLEHPHIVSFGVVTKVEQGFSFIEQLANQGMIWDVEERGEEFSYRKLKKWFKGYLRALEYLHEKGLVHGDIKPQNLLLHNDEGLLADFECLQKEGGKISGGTFDYISPEAVFEEKVYAASDMWSLGVSLYVLLFEEDLYELEILDFATKEMAKNHVRQWFTKIKEQKGGFEQYLREKMQKRLRDYEILRRVEELDPKGFIRSCMLQLLCFKKEDRLTSAQLLERWNAEM